MVPPDWVPVPLRVSVKLFRLSVLLPVTFISMPEADRLVSRVGCSAPPRLKPATPVVGSGTLFVQLAPFPQEGSIPLPPVQLVVGTCAVAPTAHPMAKENA